VGQISGGVFSFEEHNRRTDISVILKQLVLNWFGSVPDKRTDTSLLGYLYPCKPRICSWLWWRRQGLGGFLPHSR